jgi:uncharacterized protein with FMN-binding domain
MCSEADALPPAAGPAVARLAAAAAVILIALALGPRQARAQPVLTQEEALRLAFPAPAVIERRTAYLSEGDVERAARLAGPGVDVDAALVTHYVGAMDGEALGVAYFDAHRVRTLPEVLMVVVSTAGTVERIEVLKFSEPPEYRAPEGWLAQFAGEGLTDDVSLKTGIVNMTGASLTSEAITDAVRRVLALHTVLQPFAAQVSR